MKRNTPNDNELPLFKDEFIPYEVSRIYYNNDISYDIRNKCISDILEVAFQVKFSDKRLTILNLSDNFRKDINKMYYDRYSKFY